MYKSIVFHVAASADAFYGPLMLSSNGFRNVPSTIRKDPSVCPIGIE